MLFCTGAIFALLSGYGAFTYVRAMEREVAQTREAIAAFGEMAQVPVPTRDVLRGNAIAAEDFRMMMIPSASIPSQIMRELPELPEGITAYIAFEDMKEGGLVSNAGIGQSSDHPNGLSLSADARAMILSPSNMDEVGASLTPGSRIDVFWTNDEGAGSQTRLLASSLRLVSLTGEGGVLLEGGPEDAARYVQARQSGTFHILPTNSLRNLDEGEVVVSATDLANLPLAVRQGAGGVDLIQQIGGTPTCTLSVVRSADRSVVEVPC